MKEFAPRGSKFFPLRVALNVKNQIFYINVTLLQNVSYACYAHAYVRNERYAHVI